MDPHTRLSRCSRATLAAVLIVFAVQCTSDDRQDNRDAGAADDASTAGDSGPGDDAGSTPRDTIRFAVLADPHYYDTDLGTSGSAWEAYLDADRKLLAESPALLDAAVEAILAIREELDFVIVPGDLTKDGERSGHEEFAAQIRALEDSGLEVYVCPGNHDIENPHAVRFDGDATSPVDRVSAERFADLYADFGYGQSFDRHDSSLSYVAEPVEGFRIIAIDSCKYENNLADEFPQTSGALDDATLAWVIGKLEEARQEGKTVFAFQHHGLVEHFIGQSTLPGIGDEYVIDEWESVSQSVAEAGLNLIFTGHYHAQDITKQTWEDSDAHVFDVETGSLVSYPNSWRTVTLRADGEVAIESHFIEAIDYDTDGQSFPEYAKAFLAAGIEGNAHAYLAVMSVSEEISAEMKPVGVEAFIAHYAGDENLDEQTLEKIEQFADNPDSNVSFLGEALRNLASDREPADTTISFNMNTGVVGE